MLWPYRADEDECNVEEMDRSSTQRAVEDTQEAMITVVDSTQ